MTRPLPDRAFDRLEEAVAPMIESDRPPKPALGKYRLVRELARGAMGVVYEAEDTELQRTVALKLLREFAGSKEVVRYRFQREALASAKLNHPNVVRVYDSGEEDGRMYLVMELVRGRPLSEILGGRAYEPRPMLFLLEKVARGVAAAHEAGIVHRDVKPANILVTEGGEPKVGDFGLAHWLESDTQLTKTGTPLGTPMYMAPEQVRGGGSVTPATDVYALGGILYEILTGRPPHTGDNTAEIYGKILSDDPVAPKRLNTRVHFELEIICLKALDKEPGRRYATAKEFADDLRRHLDGESIVARPPGMATVGVKWVKRHRTASVATAAGIAVLLATLLWTSADRGRAIGRFMDQGRQALGEGRRGDAVDAFTRALGLDPRHGDARRSLAEIYYADFERAEEEGNEEAMKANRRLVTIYDDGPMTAKLAEGGTLSIDSRPPGAEVELLRYKEGEDGRLVAVPDRSLGRCPVVNVERPVGSYLLLLRKEGCRETRYPILVRRGGHHEGTVNLYTDAEIGPDFVYVPAGTFLTGGDPKAYPGRERRHDAKTGDLFFAKFEVTLGEYFEFLNAVIAAEGTEEAQKRVPRQAPNAGHFFRIRPEWDRLQIPPVYDPSTPITSISSEDAEAYCAWRTAQAGGGSVYRLPTSVEWEKAARGADGRWFPWGNSFNWAFTKGAKSREGPLKREPVGAFEKDESPYGVRDMAGSAQEWCGDWFDEERGSRFERGGSWNHVEPLAFRSAGLDWNSPKAVNARLGFRLVKEPPKR